MSLTLLRFLFDQKLHELISVMIVLCGNCEERSPIVVCDQCEGDDSFFCQKCWNIHVQVKAFRNHTSQPVFENNECLQLKKDNATTSQILGENLQKLKMDKFKTGVGSLPDKTPSQSPSQSTKPSKNYVQGIEKVLQNIADKRPDYKRDYNDMISKWSNDRISEKAVLDVVEKSGNEPLSFLEHIDDLIDTFSNVSDNGEMNINVVVYGLICALLIHIVTKLIFGRLSIFAIAGVGLVVMALVRNRQNSLNVEIAKLQNANDDFRSDMRATKIGDPTQINTVSAENDFWHSDSKSSPYHPRLRSRVRPYQSNRRGVKESKNYAHNDKKLN